MSQDEDRLDFVGLEIGQEVADAFRKLISERQWRLVCFKNCKGRVSDLVLDVLEHDSCQELWLTAASEDLHEDVSSSLTSSMRCTREGMGKTQCLRSFRLSSVLDLGQASLLAEGLRDCSSLIELDLTGLQVIDRHAAEMVAFGVQENSSLKSIHMADDSNRVAYLEESIIRCLNRRSLPMSHVTITGPCSNSLFQALAEATQSIKKLTLIPDGPQRPHRFNLLLRSPSRIDHLELSRNSIDDSIFASILEELIENETLRFLDLSFNKISEDGLLLLANALPKLKLKQLKLQENHYKGEGRTGTQFLEAVRHNTDIELLMLDNIAVGCAEIAHIVRLNIGGRRILHDPKFKISLLPAVIARASRMTFALMEGPERLTAQADTIFHLLRHGPINKEPQTEPNAAR